jgi:hypothetical protein
MRTLSASVKGIITATLIILISGIVYGSKGNFDNSILLAAYFLYAAGIVWTMVSYHRSIPDDKSFKKYFQEGFKCYVVVTLIMVCATWLFLKFNSPLREQMVSFQREQLSSTHNYTLPEIDTQLARYRKFILPAYTMAAILSYLGIGTLITGLFSFFLNKLGNEKP